MNELIWLLIVVVDFSLTLIAFKLFGKFGLYSVIVTSILVANIQVLMTTKLFGLVTTLGNVLYGGIFLATDMLSEKYGKVEAKRGVWLGFFALVSITLYMQLALLFVPDSSDFAYPHLSAIFSLLPRVAFASLVAYLVSQFHDVWAYDFWKRKTKGKYLWFRNNASTWVSQLIDTTIFCTIAFLGVWPSNIFIQIFVTTYLFKLIVAILDTPIIYLMRKIKPNA